MEDLLTLRSHRESCGIQHLRLHQLNGNSTIGSRIKVGILGDPHPGLNSSDFFNSEMLFRLPEIRIPWQSTGVWTYTPHFHMHSHCTVQTTCVPWVKGPKGLRRIVCQKHSLIHASCFTLRLTVH